MPACDPLISSPRIYQLINFVIKDKEEITLQNVSFSDEMALIEEDETLSRALAFCPCLCP